MIYAMWSIRRCTDSKNLEQYETLLQGQTPCKDLKAFVRMDPWLFHEIVQRLGPSIR